MWKHRQVKLLAVCDPVENWRGYVTDHHRTESSWFMKKFRVTNGIKGLCEIKVNYINTVTIMKWECPVVYTIRFTILMAATCLIKKIWDLRSSSRVRVEHFPNSDRAFVISDMEEKLDFVYYGSLRNSCAMYYYITGYWWLEFNLLQRRKVWRYPEHERSVEAYELTVCCHVVFLLQFYS